jgi:DNA polymerase III delta prime subunit
MSSHKSPALENNLAARQEESSAQSEGSPINTNLCRESLPSRLNNSGPLRRRMISVLQRIEELDEFETDSDNRLRVACNKIDEKMAEEVSKRMNSPMSQEEYDRKLMKLIDKINGLERGSKSPISQEECDQNLRI